jgi:hypothetical protein
LKTPSYLSKRKTKKNFNLQTSDISGAQPKSHFKKLEEKITRAKKEVIKAGHTCGKYNPYEPSLINLKQDPDDTQSHMLEVDYKQIKAKKGQVSVMREGVPVSGKYIYVKGNRKYLDTTEKDKFMDQRREQKNKVGFMNDLSKKTDRVNDPNQRKDKHIRREGKNRRDCSQDYKYIAKNEKREYINKKDLRYDVLDINDKQIKFVPDELENDPDYLAYRQRIKEAGQKGYLPEISNPRIDRFVEFENGRRVWRSKSESRVGLIRNLGSKRSTSPIRVASRNRVGRVSYLSKDEVDIKPYNPVQRDYE